MRAAIVLAGCVGAAPPDHTAPPDAEVPVSRETARLVGRTLDAFVPTTALLDAAVATGGAMATSTDEGDYFLDGVPVGSRLFVTVTLPNYRPTRNPATPLTAGELAFDLGAVSIADARRQYTTLGKLPAPGTAIAIATVVDGTGAPLAGVPVAQLAIVDEAGAPVPGVLGPFAFGAAGDLDRAATATVGGGGRARVAFLDVPAAPLALRFGDAREPIEAVAGGAVLVAVRGTPGAPVVADPGFAADVHPRLQTAANGGLGCANCHTLGGSGAVLPLDGPADQVREALLAAPGAVTTASPAASLLLVRPLYEPVPDHPNATFLDASDPDYELIRRWIANGATP